ncbi:hypothetical protein KC460_02170 [Candidatus Dependentiae bacterium]|nr:hypothetical protein [Candidatus Dependentiae bacterium]
MKKIFLAITLFTGCSMGFFTTAFSNGHSAEEHRRDGDCKEKKNLSVMTKENLISYANFLEKQLEVEKNKKSSKLKICGALFAAAVLGGGILYKVVPTAISFLK